MQGEVRHNRVHLQTQTTIGREEEIKKKTTYCGPRPYLCHKSTTIYTGKGVKKGDDQGVQGKQTTDCRAEGLLREGSFGEPIPEGRGGNRMG